jgi:hypothetical protein
MGGAQKQEETWHYVLKALAAHFGLKGEVQMVKTCVDARLQWSQARNIWYNAGIRTMLHTPVRFLRKLVKG